jgi:UDP-glucuronate 4-epimerase
MTVLVTGIAGFIGFHVADALAARGDAVVGIDDVNGYYTPRLKEDRLAELDRRHGGRIRVIRADIAREGGLNEVLAGIEIDRIVHLAAQAGVRYSIENPRAYVRANLVGHLEVLEFARTRRTAQLVYASSSSVYGGNEAMPFRVEDAVDQPISLYAATKRADELMGESYAHLYRLPQTGLRFFTVYGPWGRPDMAPWLFTSAILERRPIRLFNGGDMARDFTFVDDVVAGILAALDRPPADDGNVKPGGGRGPHAIYNIGNHRPERLDRFVSLIEQACGEQAIRELLPMQPGDVPATYADIAPIARDLGFSPATPLEDGVPRFVDWYRTYTGV